MTQAHPDAQRAAENPGRTALENASAIMIPIAVDAGVRKLDAGHFEISRDLGKRMLSSRDASSQGLRVMPAVVSGRFVVVIIRKRKELTFHYTWELDPASNKDVPKASDVSDLSAE